MTKKPIDKKVKIAGSIVTGIAVAGIAAYFISKNKKDKKQNGKKDTKCKKCSRRK